MNIPQYIISLGLCASAIVACDRPASASAEPSGKAQTATSHEHDHCNPQQAAATGKESCAQTVAIAVGEDGFAPSHVELERGSKTTLRFTRTTDKTCATEVVFPELGLNKPLPLNQAVDVEIVAEQARSLTFQCGMGMYKSKVVVL